jgi:hypothetical protein
LNFDEPIFVLRLRPFNEGNQSSLFETRVSRIADFRTLRVFNGRRRETVALKAFVQIEDSMRGGGSSVGRVPQVVIIVVSVIPQIGAVLSV